MYPSSHTIKEGQKAQDSPVTDILQETHPSPKMPQSWQEAADVGLRRFLPPPTPPHPSIRSSSVARLQGLFLLSTDTWHTNECPSMWIKSSSDRTMTPSAGICLPCAMNGLKRRHVSSASAAWQQAEEGRLAEYGVPPEASPGQG